MASIYCAIFNLLANAFCYPTVKNTSDKFFCAIKALAEDLGYDINESPELELLRYDYTRLFINNSSEEIAPLYASFYCTEDNLLMQHSRDEAKDFYQKAGLEPKFANEPEDFLPTELYFISELLKKGNSQQLAGFLRHINGWFPLFKKRLQALNPHPYYHILSEITLVILTNLYQEVINEKT